MGERWPQLCRSRATPAACRRITDLLAHLQNIELAGDPKDEQALDTVAQYLEMTPAERQALLEMDGALLRARALVQRLDRR